MRDGKALQMGTSHELGQGFAKAFGITFLDESGQQVVCLADVVGRVDPADGRAHHGPRRRRRAAAPAPAGPCAGGRAGRAHRGRRRRSRRRRWPSSCGRPGSRVELDVRTELSFGRRVVGWELKGVPVRVEVGPRDLATGTVVLCRRDDTSKTSLPLDRVVASVNEVLEASQAALLAEALRRREENTVRASTLEEAEEAVQSGFAVMPGALLAARRRGRPAQCRWDHGPAPAAPRRLASRG